MLGFRSLEKKLRDGNGRAAPASVLGIEKGKSLNWKSETGPHGSGNYVEQGTVSKDRYRLQVQPEGEPAFEAVVKIPEDEFFGLYALRVGSTITVLFDPDDHEKVAVDVAGTKTEMESQRRTLKFTVTEAPQAGAAPASDALSPSPASDPVAYWEQYAAEKLATLGAAGAEVRQGGPAASPGSVEERMAAIEKLHVAGVLTDRRVQGQAPAGHRLDLASSPAASQSAGKRTCVSAYPAAGFWLS
jgi:hypothetical protein